MIAIYTLFACSGCKSSKTSEYIKTPEEIGKLVTNDLLSRSEFMMYHVDEVISVHYAEACAGYGAIKLSAFLKDKETIQKPTDRYDSVITENIPNSANHVDANAYGILPEEPYHSAYIKAWNALTRYIDQDGKIQEVCIGTGQSVDMNYYLSRPRIAGDLHGQAPILWFAYILANYPYIAPA